MSEVKMGRPTHHRINPAATASVEQIKGILKKYPAPQPQTVAPSTDGAIDVRHEKIDFEDLIQKAPAAIKS